MLPKVFYKRNFALIFVFKQRIGAFRKLFINAFNWHWELRHKLPIARHLLTFFNQTWAVMARSVHLSSNLMTGDSSLEERFTNPSALRDDQT